MAQHIMKCPACHAYTLRPQCSLCLEKTLLPSPPKFSLPDKYGKYRREAKRGEFLEKGLI